MQLQKKESLKLNSEKREKTYSFIINLFKFLGKTHFLLILFVTVNDIKLEINCRKKREINWHHEKAHNLKFE